ncbi:MBL fold metallo-hydrolase [Clostridium ganghwense]|uniref:MBL fold metallo-hydrolase n=1 Tax=Clostridium ganghwense TaxID=312089 RepID=A0ABT4CT99_9CLOT|nr:MBL fold metallo-hydrolase [Clostridium ganghwense]MCY6372306.1 MBL fold metallo-hydrolase [Clostridium ganghwense]
MKIKRVGSRGYMFTFFELVDTEFDCSTNVYLIDGKDYLFLCDTYLGPKSMLEIKKFINKHLDEKPIIVFNSHSDWDHIWGNCFFKNSIIISHEICREDIEKNALYELNKYKEHCQGEVKIYIPNLTFKERLDFIDEDIEFFYSPGHTNNSASCFDRKDNVLFVGDNIENPQPYLTCNNFDIYEKTLNKYIEIQADYIIPGHGDVANYDLVRKNLKYIKKCAYS